MSTPLNVGPKSAAWLRQVGVRSREDLVEVGAVAAFVKCKRAGFRPSLNMLYALEGALLGCHWQKVPEARRAELQAQAEADIALIPPPRGRVAALTVSAVRDVVVEGEGDDELSGAAAFESESDAGGTDSDD